MRRSSEPKCQLLRLKTGKARSSFEEFVIQAWPIPEPGIRFVGGMDVYCTILSPGGYSVAIASRWRFATAFDVGGQTKPNRTPPALKQLVNSRRAVQRRFLNCRARPSRIRVPRRHRAHRTLRIVRSQVDPIGFRSG
jgi:hypothetical protein